MADSVILLDDINGDGKAAKMSIPEKVSTFLRQRDSAAYCDDCIQRGAGLKRRQQAQRVTGALGQTSDFIREKAICAGCGSDTKFATRAIPK